MNQVAPVSIDRPSILSRVLFWVGLLVIPTILIIQVLVYQPFFGHYEDGLRLRFVDENGLVPSLRESFFRAGDAYGYLGASGLSQIWSHLPYEIGNHFGPALLYTLNVIQIVFAITLFIWGILLLGKSSVMLLGLVSGVLASAIWPFTYEMIFFPGADEKGIILSVAVIFLLLSLLDRLSKSWLAYLLMPLIPLILLLNKSQILTFVPGLMIALLFLRNCSNLRRFALLALLASTACFQFWMALIGGYSSGVQNTSLSNLLSVPALLASASVGLFVLLLLFSWFNSTFRQPRFFHSGIKLLIIPIPMMIFFVVGIFLWGGRNYWFAIFGVMFGSAVAVVVGNLKAIELQQVATAGLIVVAVGWTLYRIPQVFEPLHGIGAFTQGQIARELAEEGAVIYTSCVEGSEHFNYYTERKWGITPEFVPLTGDGAGYRFGIPDDGQYVFGDRRLCPAPDEVATWAVLWASPGDDGFRLYGKAK